MEFIMSFRFLFYGFAIGLIVFGYFLIKPQDVAQAYLENGECWPVRTKPECFTYDKAIQDAIEAYSIPVPEDMVEIRFFGSVSKMEQASGLEINGGIGPKKMVLISDAAFAYNEEYLVYVLVHEIEIHGNQSSLLALIPYYRWFFEYEAYMAVARHKDKYGFSDRLVSQTAQQFHRIYGTFPEYVVNSTSETFGDLSDWVKGYFD
jgi:hypothetical protein